MAGTHSMESLLLQGPDCKSGIKLNPLEIVDILPTVLYQFNLPIDSNVDGRVVKDVFKKNLLTFILLDMKM